MQQANDNELFNLQQAENTRQFLTMGMGGETYGLEILKVHEIIGLIDITRVPRVPRHIRGVINLRGRVIPIIDLRLRFEFSNIVDTEETCIVVVDPGDTVMGVIVDRVSDVIDIHERDIEPPPEFGRSVNTDYILGMAKTRSQVVMLLDISKILAEQELLSA